MAEETWETVSGSQTKISKVCVKYCLKWANICFSRSNIAEELGALLTKRFSEDEIRQKFPKGTEEPLRFVEMDIYVTTQLSSLHSRIRFVIGKNEGLHSDPLRISLRNESGQLGDCHVKIWSWYKLNLNTAAIAAKLGCDHVAFADSGGAPTTRAVFEIAEEGASIVVTAPVVKLSKEEFTRLFKIKSKKAEAK